MGCFFTDGQPIPSMYSNSILVMFGKFINPKLVYISYEYGDVLMVSKKSGWYGIFHRYLHFSMTNGRVSYSTAMSHQSHISIPLE